MKPVSIAAAILLLLALPPAQDPKAKGEKVEHLDLWGAVALTLMKDDIEFSQMVATGKLPGGKPSPHQDLESLQLEYNLSRVWDDLSADRADLQKLKKEQKEAKTKKAWDAVQIRINWNLASQIESHAHVASIKIWFDMRKRESFEKPAMALYKAYHSVKFEWLKRRIQTQLGVLYHEERFKPLTNSGSTPPRKSEGK